ncbi:MAG: hypothetical protein JXA18_11935 [Chitinispirillaceae bacterium]|nr:hypothetical protein [Chitinispirillaceae bacterium]
MIVNLETEGVSTTEVIFVGRYGGQETPKTIVEKTGHKPMSVEVLAGSLNEYF